jgi:hypothetical protein
VRKVDKFVDKVYLRPFACNDHSCYNIRFESFTVMKIRY